MSIIRTMTTGASGLRAESDALGVVSDNIANVSTVGFKRSRAVFEDVLGRSVMGSSALQTAGNGSRVSQVQQLWTQGALVGTGVSTDLAISGDGLFVVNGAVDGVQGQFYTRAGQFHADADGFLVNPDGLRLQGYPADDQGNIGGALGDLRVGGGTLPATPTSSITIAMSLDSRTTIPTPPVPFDPANPPTGSTTTSMQIVDSLGNRHDATVYFNQTSPGVYTWNAVVAGDQVAGGATTDPPVVIGTGTLTFDSSGALASEATTSGPVDFAGGAAGGQTIAWDFGTSTTEGGTGLDGSTFAGRPAATLAKSQDGFSGGQVAGIRVEADGTVTGVFGSGEERALGQLAVASFTSVEGLARSGHNLFQQTDASGDALLGTAGSGGRGSIVAGTLESSNVDLGSEFVDLIQFQRGFSANSKIITTADEMYQELVNMRR